MMNISAISLLFVSFLNMIWNVQGIYLIVNNEKRENRYVYKYDIGEIVRIECLNTEYSWRSINMAFNDTRYNLKYFKPEEKSYFGITYSIKLNITLNALYNGLKVVCSIIPLFQDVEQTLVTFKMNDKAHKIPVKIDGTKNQTERNYTNLTPNSDFKNKTGKDKMESAKQSTKQENRKNTNAKTTNLENTSIMDITWLAILLSCFGIGVVIIIIVCVIFISSKKTRKMLDTTVKYENVEKDLSSNQIQVTLGETQRTLTSDLIEPRTTNLNMTTPIEDLYSTAVPKSMRTVNANEITYASLEFEDLMQTTSIRNRRIPSSIDESGYANVGPKNFEPSYVEVQKDINIK